ncbi:MAG: hypothetical protein QW136_00025 [Nitrososphaerales archaeon]
MEGRTVVLSDAEELFGAIRNLFGWNLPAGESYVPRHEYCLVAADAGKKVHSVSYKRGDNELYYENAPSLMKFSMDDVAVIGTYSTTDSWQQVYRIDKGRRIT